MAVRLGNATRKATCHCVAQNFKTKNLTTRGYQMLDISKIYTSNNYGDFIILKYINSRNVEIEFISTGFKRVTCAGSINKGNLKDLLAPLVCGVGFIGDGIHKAVVDRKVTKAHRVWYDMIRRCYSESNLKAHPTYFDCYVCDEWHNFQAFAAWFYKNHIDGHQLDKDIKVKGNKVYSPATCIFASPKDNTIESSAKSYCFLSPKGKAIKIYNLAEFCELNNLEKSNMYAVHSGKRRAHKGWTKHYCPSI